MSFFSRRSIDLYQSWKKPWRAADLHQDKLVGLLEVGRDFQELFYHCNSLFLSHLKPIPQPQHTQALLLSSVQFSHSIMSDSCDPMHCNIPGLPVHHPLPELAQTYVHQVGDAIQPSHPLLSPPASAFSVSNESVLRIRWPKYWSFNFSISLSNECSGLISFRIDWFDLLAVWGTLKSLLQHYSSKASILWCSAFFIVQLSHPYMTTGKTIALTRKRRIAKGLFKIPWVSLACWRFYNMNLIYLN